MAVGRVDERETSTGGSGVANLADLLVELAGLPDDASDLEGCLRLIARRVADTVAGVDYASVTSSRDGQATTVAMSSDVALEVDSSQYAAGGGPCLDALAGQPVAVEDIAADMQWPDFRRTAIKLGLHMSLASPRPRAARTGRRAEAHAAADHLAGAMPLPEDRVKVLPAMLQWRRPERHDVTVGLPGPGAARERPGDARPRRGSRRRIRAVG